MPNCVTDILCVFMRLASIGVSERLFRRVSENSVSFARGHSLSYIFNYVGQYGGSFMFFYSFYFSVFFLFFFYFFPSAFYLRCRLLSAVAGGGGGWISVASRMPGVHNLATRRLAEPIRSSAVRRKVEIYSRADEISRRNELCRFIRTKMTIL